jgi:uncharacterized protein YndB with AHSA1/START domain
MESKGIRMTMTGKAVVEREVTLTRVFDAPRPLVFSMWTDAKHVAAWWGPHGFDNPKTRAAFVADIFKKWSESTCRK